MKHIKYFITVKYMTTWASSIDSAIINKVIALSVQYSMQIVSAVVILIFGIWASKISVKIIDKLLSIRNVEDTIRIFIKRILYYLLIIFVLIAVLSKLGVQTTSLVAVLGGLGIAVAYL